MPSLTLSNSLGSSSPFSKLDRWSLAFDGSNDYIDLGDEFKSTIADAHSVSFWVKFEDAQPSGTNYIAGCRNASGEDNFYVAITSSGALKWYLKGNNDPEEGACSTTLDDGVSAWTHFVVTASMGESAGDTVTFYLNGSATNSTSLSGITKSNWNAYDSGMNLVLGAYNNNTSVGGNLECNISDFAFYSKALSAGEVTSIYDGGDSYRHDTGVAKANLAGWWRMGDGVENGTGTTVYDASSNSNNGTMTNMDAGDFEEDSP